MENKTVVIASSRSGATEVYRFPDGRLMQVEHLKSGRDVSHEVPEIPQCLTIRYEEPYPEAPEIEEFVRA